MQRLSIKVTSNAKSLSSYSGLHLFSDLISKFEIKSALGQFLPRKERMRGFSSFQKFFAGILGFVAGAECLDDLDWLGQDPLFHELTNSPSSITVGNFLRSFSPRQVEQLRNQLPSIALRMRLWLQPNLYKITFKMDSSDHEQYGLKMEGVDYGYRKVRCLNSQNLFDDKGLCYGFDLRKGNTFSSKGAVEMMENAFSVIPKTIQKYFVADSAYGTLAIYNSLLNHNVNFAICLKENVWGPQLEKSKNKITWRKTKLYFFESDKCEIGSSIYSLKGLAGRSFLRVVFIRTKRKFITSGDNHPFIYYAIVTNMTESEMSDEQVLKFYRTRAQVENNIKDLKGGMDFYHFPCQSLKANNVWGLMGVIAYNLMRMTSFTLFPRTGCFVKTTRRRLVTLAGEIIRHARSIEIRMMDFLAREVNRQLNMIRSSFYQAEYAGVASHPNGGLLRQEAL